jgi:bifunctional DNase/RNase
MIRARTRARVYLWVCLLAGAAILSACRAKEKTEVEVEVRSVGFDNASQAPVVVLQDHDRKLALPIWIGPAEAQSIAMQMQGVNPPRPMTHDLIKTMLDRTGVEFRKVVIGDLKDSTYFARIYLHAGRQDLEIDSRPSDAIALAVRFHRPIFVATALMHGATAIDLQHAAPGSNVLKVAGVSVQDMTDELAEYFSLPPGKGVLVADVDKVSPEGLRRGDVILEMNGAVITGVADFQAKLAAKSGTQVHLSVQRGGERINIPFAGGLG